MSRNMFAHAPLDPKCREIRLVRFHHSFAEAGGAELSLELRHVSFDKDEVSYAALSYVWGNAADTVTIKIDGDLFGITRNLYGALRQLEQNGIDSWLWIDAICIAQDNLTEKSQQINAMRDMITSADLVYMWLGPGSEGSDIAMGLVSRMGPRLLANGALDLSSDWRKALEIHQYLKEKVSCSSDVTMPLEDTGLSQVVYELLTEYQALETKYPLGSGIRSILNRDYWCRAWIIQEAVLARRAVIMVGTRYTHLDAFDATLVTIWYGLAYFLPPSSTTLDTIKALEIRRSRLQGYNLRLVDILWERRDALNRPHYTATDPRDIVFGLLGILEDEEAQKIRADYTQLFEEVFIRATRVMLDSTAGDAPKSVNFRLDSINPGTPNSALPTWVPDWRRIGYHGVDIGPINSSGRYNASGSLSHQHQWSLGSYKEGRCLRQRGCIVDEVTDVMRKSHRVHQSQLPSLTLSDEVSWLQAVNTFVGLGIESTRGEEYVWRTLTNDSYHASAHGTSCGQECVMIGELATLCRRVMRADIIDASALTEGQKLFIKQFLSQWQHVELGDQESLDKEHVVSFGRQWRRQVTARNRNRTLFKTAKGMLGRGHLGLDVGDIVVLIWGVSSPIVLRRRNEEGFYFQGDAYVDGIMHGEYLDTHPKEEEFTIF